MGIGQASEQGDTGRGPGRLTWRRVSAAALLLCMVLVAACGGGDDAADTSDADDTATSDSGADAGTDDASGTDATEAEAEEDAAPTEEEVATEPVDFQFAIGAAGVLGPPVIAALEAMNERYGHNGEFVDLAESEVAIEGVAANQYQFGAGATFTVMQAIQQRGAELTFIAEALRSDWTLVGKSEIESCDDMDGHRMGLHSPGGVSTALFVAWQQENCDPSVEPQIVYIAGSPNRYQGLLADQLDVTMLQLENTLDLDERFHIMANFSQDLPNIKTSTVYVNDQFMQEHPEVVQQFVTELIRISREYNENPDLLGDHFAEFMPETADTAHQVTAAYVDAGLIPEDGALSLEDMQDTIDLFVQAEVIEEGLTAEEITTTEFIEQALAELDG